MKDTKAGKAGGKDGKTPAGGGAAGSAPDADKGQPAAPEVLPVESPPAVGRSLFIGLNLTLMPLNPWSFAMEKTQV